MRDGQFFHRSAHRFPEADGDLVFQVGAGLPHRSLGCGPAASEKLAEEVAEAGAPAAAEIEPAEIELHARAGVFHGPRSLAVGVEAELVVRLPLLRIRQDVIRFLDLLEFFLGGFISGIQVGVILARQFPVGLANVLLRGFARNSQKLVEVLLAGRRHKLLCHATTRLSF